MRSRPEVLSRCLLAAVMVFSSHWAAAGPFSDWLYRTPVQLNNAGGTETLLNFPLLVNLNAGNFDFGKAKADGSDVRFALPGGALLSYEIEKWDPVASTAAVWVKVPQIDLGPGAGLINMYTGNAAAADAQNAPDVWSNGYVGVWHLGASPNDSTAWGNHGTTSGTVTLAPGVAGDARLFNLGSIRTPAVSNGSLDMGDNITVSYWMSGAAADQPGGYTRVVAKNSDSVSGWEYQRGGADAHQSVRIDTSAGNNQVRSNAPGAFDGQWHFVGTTLSSGAVRGYKDSGAAIVSSYGVGDGFGNTLPLVIGARAAGSTGFRGLVDEVRVSNVVRTDAWMTAEYRSQAGQMAVVGGTLLVGDLMAEYSHEATNLLMDTSGGGYDATNAGGAGGVAFVPVADPQGFAAGLGSTAGSYVRSHNQRLELPAGLAADLGESFTFTALVQGDGLVAGGGHQTILGSNRFRFQRGNTDQLLLQVNRPSGSGTGLVQAAAGTLDPGTWYMAVLRYDAATNRADTYLVPGTSIVTSPNLALTPTEPMTNINSFRIGSDGLSGIGSFDGWNGLIDNARFYEGALTKRELRDVFYSYTGHFGAVGLLAQYTHENAANRLADDTGHGLTLANAGGVTFAASPNPGGFDLGDTVGQYSGASNSYSTVPELYTAGDDFTFLAMVRVNADSGHQTILGSDRFRLQYYPVTTGDGLGSLLLQVNADGASGPTSSTYGSFMPGEWHLVAMMYDAETKKIETYVQPDSPVLFGSAFMQTALGPQGLDTMTRFRLGADGLSGIGSPDALAGHIDGVRFYDQTFTKVQLRDIFREYRPAPPGPIGLLAHYTHDSANPLADDTGHLATLTNGGGVGFVAPIDPGPFDLGTTVGQYSRTSTGYLDVPNVHTPDDDFTFTAMVRKDAAAAGHHTIFSTNRFRLQFRGTSTDAGTLRLDVNGANATGHNETAVDGFPTQEWMFVAMTYDAATRQIQAWLQDGSPVFLGPDMTRIALGAIGIDDMNRFQVGGNISGIGLGDNFRGQMDGVRFYDTLLTKRELRDVFREYNPLPAGAVGLVAEYTHEGPNPLADDTGHGVTAVNRGLVSFVAPPPGGIFRAGLGSVVGHYPRQDNGSLDFPQFYTSGDDFTFTALVRKDSDESGGQQTILASDRFRLQFQDTGTMDDELGQLYLQVNGAGSTGPTGSGSDTFATEEWYFVALRYDAGSQALQAFLDSEELGGPAISQVVNEAMGLDDMLNFRIGADGLSGLESSDPFGGWIDRVQFYDRFLSDVELRQLFNAAIPEPSAAMLLLLGLISLPLVRQRHRPRIMHRAARDA